MAFISRASSVIALALMGGLAACSSGESGNTEPVNMGQFHAGDDRFNVISAVGQPMGTVKHLGRACDIYRLYTAGLSAGGRAGVKAAEVVTSIATLGLAQAVWAPVNAGSHPNQHTVLFCYASNNQLVEIYDKNPTNSRKPVVKVINKALYTTPANGSADEGASIDAEATSAMLPAASATTAGGVTSVNPPAPADLAPAPITVQPETLVPDGVKIDHVTTDPTTGQKTIYEKAATPASTDAAGNISLDNVSREAINGTDQVKTGQVVIPQNATADDLNSLSGQKAAQANKPALGAAAALTPTPSESVPDAN
ncbi:hypothetical protein [Acetobacter malorum]|nr:hypothetical protein [Acetobacter malorum]